MLDFGKNGLCDAQPDPMDFDHYKKLHPFWEFNFVFERIGDRFWREANEECDRSFSSSTPTPELDQNFHSSIRASPGELQKEATLSDPVIEEGAGAVVVKGGPIYQLL